VVLLYPEARLLPEILAVEDAIRPALDPDGEVSLYTEYLDLARATDEQYERQVIALLREKYASRRVDLIMPVAFPALRFFLSHRAELFPGVPAVFCAANLNAVAGSISAPTSPGCDCRRSGGRRSTPRSPSSRRRGGRW